MTVSPSCVKRMETTKKKSFKMPHVFVILMIIMLLVVIISYLVPSGVFERTTTEAGVSVVNPDNFQLIPSSEKYHISFMDYFMSIYDGVVAGGTIMASLLICSGVLGLIETTGSFAAGIHKLLGASKGKEFSMVVVFYSVFCLFGVLGFGEGAYPFFPLAVSIVMALGYDRVAGAGTIILSTTAGFACGMLNLFTTGISQQMVGLPMFSGIGYRAVCLVVFYLIGIISLYLYCRKIKKDPNKSYVKEEYLTQKSEFTEEDTVPFTWKRIVTLIGFVLLVIIQGYGCIKLQWGLGNVVAIYVMFAILLCLLFQIGPTDACNRITAGATRVLGAALAIGLARSVMLLLDKAQILDTLVHAMGNALEGKNVMITLLLIYLFVTALNFFVVSGSGKAVMMMPILSPLGKMLGINQQVMVLTYQLGDGLTNNLWPAGALVGCALCDLDYGAWWKLAWKALGSMIVAGYFLIIIANAMNYGPF